MSLTPRRLERITPILETYRGKLRASGAFRPESLEAEIKATLDVGYQEVKHLLIDLLKKPRYQTVAAYYLQHFAAPNQPSEAKLALGDLYGVGYYEHADRPQAQDAWWTTAMDQLRSEVD